MRWQTGRLLRLVFDLRLYRLLEFRTAAQYAKERLGGSRAGFPAAFINRVRQCVWPQFLIDQLPIGGPKESVLRLDHIQPVGVRGNSHIVTEHQMSPQALEILDDWLVWLMTGLVPEG
ncbi:MAG: hypothetical protein E6J72_07745 [Deltaproteobacteria bacterium]|nr:MAG: hypothetical protein E6J72_07745 [Deltaproteobacteria bacterium]